MKVRNFSKQYSINPLQVRILLVKTFVLFKKMHWTCATLTLRSWQWRRLCRSTGHQRGRAVRDRKNAPFYSLLNFEEHTAHGEAFLHTSCHEVCEHSLISARTEHALGYRPAIGMERNRGKSDQCGQHVFVG